MRKRKSDKVYKLDSCPLCEGAARMIRRRPLMIKGEEKHVAYAKCTECFARSGFVILEEFEHWEDAWDLVAKRWNERPGKWRPDIPAEDETE